MKQHLRLVVTGVVLALFVAAPAHAGVTLYEKGDKKIEVGARIQVQYLLLDPEVGESTDRIFFRRLRPYIKGTVTKNWNGKIQVDFGENLDDNEVTVKDAYMQFTGWTGLKLSVGNTKTPFSREFLTSSTKQELVHRTVPGDHNFGGPDRQLGIKLDGQTSGKKLTYAASIGGQMHDPDINRMDFDSPASDNSDWNQGAVYAARVDFHPLGYLPFSQGDFHTDKWLFTVSGAAFTWSNDDDRNSYLDPNGFAPPMSTKVDLDSADGFEVSGGLRGFGWSVDAEYDVTHGETIDSTFTGGIYKNGETDLHKQAIEGGYMLPNNKVEFVIAFDSLDADNYQHPWKRRSAGVNWFINKHKLKVQLTYDRNENFLGKQGEDVESYALQLQYLF